MVSPSSLGADCSQLRILLIDPHALFRHGMRHMLVELGRPLELIEADHVDKAREAAPPPVDLVLMGLSYPDLPPLEALDQGLQSFPEAAVVVVSGQDDPTLVFEAIERGARGFIPKSSTSSVLISALRLILVGGLYLPRHVLDYRRQNRNGPGTDHGGSRSTEGGTEARACAEAVREAVRQADPVAARAADAADKAPPKEAGRERGPASADVDPASEDGLTGDALAQMTERQRQVLTRVVRGLSNKAIARAMRLSESTVKQHLSSVFKLLGVNTRTQAVLAATQLGLRIGDTAPGESDAGGAEPLADTEMLDGGR